VFCSKCGAPNSDDASFCGKCGSPLKTPYSAMPTQQSQSPYAAPPTAPQGGRKDPIIAGLLNLFVGIGYLYLGYKKVFGVPTILFVVVYFLVNIVLAIFTLGLAPLILAILMAYDGYVKARGEKGYVNTEPTLLYR